MQLTPPWWRLVVLVGAAVTVGLSTMTWHSHALPGVDAWMLQRVAAHGNPAMRVAQDVTRALTVATIASAGVLAAWAFWVLKRTDAAVLLVLSPALTLLADRGLKPMIARRAPGSTEYHFPSGHVAVAATILVSVVLIGRSAVRRLASRLALCCTAGALLLMMMWSRMADTAHLLTDVVAGAVLGSTVSLLVAVAVDRGRRPIAEAVRTLAARL